MSAEVSHGRGGAGNIRTDDTKYVDGVIVREGIAGSQGAGPFSTGRGGAANIGDSGQKPAARQDKEIVPEAAYRASSDNADYHTGRGGAGNKEVASNKKAAKENGSTPLSLADRLKNKIMGFLKK